MKEYKFEAGKSYTEESGNVPGCRRVEVVKVTEKYVFYRPWNSHIVRRAKKREIVEDGVKYEYFLAIPITNTTWKDAIQANRLYDLEEVKRGYKRAKLANGMTVLY